MIEKIPITSEQAWLALRLEDITASDIGALLNVGRWRTAYDLYAEKTGAAARQEENSAMLNGKIMEPAIEKAMKVRRPHWLIKKSDYYIRDAVRRLGATPDFDIFDLDTGRSGVMETKFTNPQSFATEWIEGPPIYVLLQVLVQMMLTDTTWGVVAVMPDGRKPKEVHWYEVERNPSAESMIYDAVDKFWASVEASKPPPRSPEAPKLELIEAMMPKNDGSVIDLSNDNRMPHILDRRLELDVEIKERQKEFKAINDELNEKRGSASIVKLSGWIITWKTYHQEEKLHKAHDVERMYIKKLEDV